jgi:hypothetical protein
MRGLGRNHWLSWIFLMKYLSICSVIVKSAITPSFIGRMAVMLPGVRPEHLLRGEADRLDGFLAVRAAFLADRDHRRLVENDPLAAHVDQCVRGAEIDRQVGGKVLRDKREHLDPYRVSIRCFTPGEGVAYNNLKITTN